MSERELRERARRLVSRWATIEPGGVETVRRLRRYRGLGGFNFSMLRRWILYENTPSVRYAKAVLRASRWMPR